MKELGAKVSYKDILDSDYPMGLFRCPNEEDGAFDGSCPCAHLNGDGFEIETRCWRTQNGYSLITVTGALSSGIKQQIADHIRDNNGWTECTEWRVEIK